MVRDMAIVPGAGAPIVARLFPGLGSRAIAAITLVVFMAAAPVSAAETCGEAVAVETHDGTITGYSLSAPTAISNDAPRVAVLLLVGGNGVLNLDAYGCVQDLKGNSLVRMAPFFRAAGIYTVLVDAPSDHRGADGLAGFRKSPAYAVDLGRIIADVRGRIGPLVWLVGTSRGTISAVNAAARLAGTTAPDGIVLTSALMLGRSGGRKPWVADTVFDLPLEELHMPLLVVGHVSDTCVRSPPSLMERIAERLASDRKQVVRVEGGPGWSGTGGAGDCIGRSPHGYNGLEAEAAAGIARFIRGERY